MGSSFYATRTIGIDDAEIFRVDVATGKSEKLLEHTGRQLLSIADVSRDGRMLLITSNAKGGYDNVALLDLATRKLRWLTHTQWSADGVAFTPDDAGVVYVLNADGRLSIRFLNLRTMHESDRGLPAGLNEPVAEPTPFLPGGSMLLSHEDSSHPAGVVPAGPRRHADPDHPQRKRDTQHTALPKSQLVTYRSFDGTLISALVWVPFNLKRDGLPQP